MRSRLIGGARAAVFTLIVASVWGSMWGSIRAEAQDGAKGIDRSEPTQKVVLLELFTSEGCSSCPPADALLRQLNGTHTSQGRLIVGISEHVTYWNSLGWQDPFSSETYTARQNAYASRFRLDSVYTPQVVVNGNRQLVGSDRAGLIKAIEEEDVDLPITLHISSAVVQGRSLRLTFLASGAESLRGADILAAVVDDLEQSNVLRGENSGRRLAHVAVARSLARVARLQTAAEQTVEIALPSDFEAKAGHHVILFAQTSGSGPVLGAAARAL